MVYNFKEYQPIFDTPQKKTQELIIARKIMELLNQNKYDSLEDFFQKNKNYQDFLKINNMDTVIKHFGNTLNEADFTLIIRRINEITKLKQQFASKDIKTTKIDDKEFNSFKGENKTYFIDNSRSKITIEDQMKSLQSSSNNFQATDARQNTENMFNELENNVKEGIKLQFLNDVNTQLLNNAELEMFKAALNYQKTTNHIVRIDFKKAIIIDEEDNIHKIEKINGIYLIKTQENNIESNEHTVSKQKQLTLAPNTSSTYSN